VSTLSPNVSSFQSVPEDKSLSDALLGNVSWVLKISLVSHDVQCCLNTINDQLIVTCPILGDSVVKKTVCHPSYGGMLCSLNVCTKCTSWADLLCESYL
jgi:hypothetical protein